MDDKIKQNDKSIEGYQAALQMVTQQGSHIWTVYAAMVAANGLLITVISAILTQCPVIMAIASFLGLLLGAAWFFIANREHCYYEFYFAWARHFEELLHRPEINMIRDGKKFAESGDSETVKLDKIQAWMKKAFKKFKIWQLMFLTVATFFTFYFVLFVWSLVLLINQGCY